MKTSKSRFLYVIVVKDVGTTWYYGTLAFRHWTYEQCSKPLLVDFSIGFCYPICWGLSQSIIVANPMNSQSWTVLLCKSCHDYEALDAKLLGCILSLDTPRYVPSIRGAASIGAPISVARQNCSDQACLPPMVCSAYLLQIKRRRKVER